MANSDEHIDYGLITKYLAGEANAEERLTVEAWLEISHLNREHFERLKLLWHETGRLIPHEEVDIDIDNAWARFKGQGKPGQSRIKRPQTISLYTYMVRVAAVIIFGVLVYLIYQNLRGPINELKLATTGEMTTDSLPDGSVISLNLHSQLTYPEKFTGAERQVTLQGEAFFEVTHDKDKPFVIKAHGATVMVLGTSFYVKAYDSLNSLVVGVQEGTVRVETDKSEVILGTGEQITLNKSIKDTTSIVAYNPNDIYWKSETLTFKNESLNEVFELLEKIYNVTVDVENPQILNCRLTAKFRQEPVGRVFDLIDANFNLLSKREADHFTISGNGCE